MDDGCDLTLILPAYNEEAGIAQAVAEADDAVRRLGVRAEIVVVDDGSTDRTAARVEDSMERHPRVRLVRHDFNRGYGAALRTGFAAARGERVAFTDADCQFHLDDLGVLLLMTDAHPIAVGYRADRKDSALRRFYSRGYNWLARALLGTRVRDIDCALKVFRRNALEKILPESSDFFVNTEMLTKARQHGLPIAEVAVRHRPRERGASKVSLGDIPRTLNALLPYWWTRVLFPSSLERERPSTVVNASGSEFAGAPGTRWQWLLMAILLLTTCVLFFSRLDHALLEPEEARYAEIPRQMLQEGRFLTPVLHGEDYWQKPPLLYLLVMLSYRCFGVHDWAARLVPCLAGVWTVVVATGWAWRVLGFWPGFVSGAILALSVRFLYLAGMLTMDALLCACVLSGLAAGHLAMIEERTRWRWLLLSAIACSLGILTKGPVALVLIAPPLIALPFLDRRTRFPAVKETGVYLAVVALIAGPWFAVMAWTAPRAAESFLWLHNLMRFVAPVDHEKPAWFYVPSLLLGTLPWSILLVPMTAYLLRRSRRMARRRPPALGMFVLGFGWCLLFFSLSGCKRPGYILPAFPLLAMMLGTFVTHGLPWQRWMTALDGARHSGTWAYRLTFTTVAMGVTISGAAAATELWTWAEAGLATGVFTALGVAVAWTPRRLPAWSSWAGCAAVVLLFLGLGQRVWLPDYHQRFGLRRQVEMSSAYEQEEDLPVVSYPKRWDSIGFYAKRNDVESYAPANLAQLAHDLQRRGKALVFVRRDRSLRELQAALPDHMEIEVLGPRGDFVAVALVRPRAVISRPAD